MNQAMLPTLPTTGEAQMLRLEHARQALAEARSVDDLKRIRDQAEAIRLYARQRGLGAEMANTAAEIKLRAERRIGELLPALIQRGGDAKTRPACLRDLGLEDTQSTRWQEVARLDADVFEHYLAEMQSRGRELTSAGLRTIAAEVADLPLASQREAVERVLDGRAATIRTAVRQVQGDWPTPPALPIGQYAVIVADPPWSYTNTRDIPTQRGTVPYAPMLLDDICALPVADLAGPDCVLWLWTTNAHMPDAFTVLAAWGFTHKTILTWVKNRIGLGRWLRGQTEHCLLAVRGHPTVRLTNQPTVLQAPVREHSRKPDEFYVLVDELCLGEKVELFARETRPGWQAWGHEEDRFNAV